MQKETLSNTTKIDENEANLYIKAFFDYDKINNELSDTEK